MAQPLIDRIRLALARHDALAPLTILGAVAGIIAGALMLAFRMSVEHALVSVMGVDDPEAFETLSLTARFLLPVIGALIVALIFAQFSTADREGGIAHIMERLAWFKSDLPWRNTVAQYLGALVTLASGHSMGREGPAIHLGAAVSSWVGRALRAPNNSMRTLIACGTAGAIAASFNTPIAGVIFAMEVVLMEYSIAGFTPVIVAAVLAAWMSRAVYGPAAAFDVPSIELVSLLELPFIVFVGIVMGALAAFFIRAISRVRRLGAARSVTWRFGLAGVVAGVCGVFMPQVMGIGYDTVERALGGHLPITLLIGIVAFKFVASATAFGLGMPAGLIAPTVVIGACMGAAMGVIGHAAAPELSASPTLYAMLGMGAMMGATLQAPLAALMAIVELTANVNIIAPGMICIVSATVTCKSVFRTDSVFLTALRERGVDYFSDPVAQAFSRLAVSTRMRTDFTVVPRVIEGSDVGRLATGADGWLIVEEDRGDYRALVHADAVTARFESLEEPGPVDLLGPGVPRHPIATVTMRATLQEARMAMAEYSVEALLVVRERRGKTPELRGILTRGELNIQPASQGR